MSPIWNGLSCCLYARTVPKKSLEYSLFFLIGEEKHARNCTEREKRFATMATHDQLKEGGKLAFCFGGFYRLGKVQH